jgi:hypothetical protein
MADTHPELAAKLQALDHELEEGDITQKGSVRRVPHFPTAISTPRHVTSRAPSTSKDLR